VLSMIAGKPRPSGWGSSRTDPAAVDVVPMSIVVVVASSRRQDSRILLRSFPASPAIEDPGWIGRTRTVQERRSFPDAGSKNAAVAWGLPLPAEEFGNPLMLDSLGTILIRAPAVALTG